MKFENTETWGFEHALRGMRNPMNSWDKSDSRVFITEQMRDLHIGEKDMELARSLIRAGSEHRKFMRQIMVSVDITAPLYWWKEFDTYKVGTVANSTSTMHKLTSQPITIDCFETDDYNVVICENGKFVFEVETVWRELIDVLELLRQTYLKTKNKIVWKELVRMLPDSWLQTRTVTMNYENIFAMVHQRKNHKLNEWSGCDNPKLPNFISWAKTLPYATEFIFCDEKSDT